MDKWLDKYQFPAQENTVKNGGRIAEDGKKVNQIGEVTVYSKKKYQDELKKQQEKYLADMVKYKQDSAQWVKANDAYQDSLSLYNETKLLADENIKYGGNAYISKEDAEKDKNRMWFSASDAPGYNKKSETYQQFKNNKTDNIQPIGYVGSDSRGRKVDGDYFFINTPVYKEPEYIPMFPNKPNSPTKVTYDPKYENLQMRSLWANKAKQDTSANIGVLNRLDYNDESKGFTINEAINFPQEIKDKYNIDYIGKQIGIKKNGGEVNKFKESTKIVRNVLPTTNIYGSQHKNTRETLDYLAGKRNFKANVPTLDNFNYNKYEGIWKSWLENGTPIINNLSEWGHWGMQAGRAYYHPEENSLNINKNNFGEYFAELAHAKQKKEGTLKNDYIKYPNREDYDRYAYEDPFSGEWDAHKVLEPSLMRKYYKEPILSDEEIKKLAKDPNNVYEERQQQGWLTSGDLDRISKQRTKNWNKKNKPLINLNFENGGIIPKAKDGDKTKKTIKVFAETPNLPEHSMYHFDDRNLPTNLRQISDELSEINKDRFPDYKLENYLKNYIDGYYLSRNRPSTKYQNDPYNTGFRAGTQEEPYYDDPNYTRNEVMQFLNKGIRNDDFTNLIELIKDFEPGLNIESKLKDFKLLREKSKNTENRIDELRRKFYEPDINPLVKGKLDNTFITEANNLKKVFKDNPNVNIDILPIYGEQDTTKVKENIKGLTANDDVIIMGHNGPQFAGIKNEWWNNAIKDSPACKYLGACSAEETVNKGFKDNNITYRPNTSWLGVNPKSDNLIDAMYSRVPSDKGDTTKTPIKGVDYNISNKYKNGGKLTNFTKPAANNWLSKYE